MDTSIYKVGDAVVFHGDAPEENDKGIVVEYQPGYMKVYWEVAKQTHDEDPEDERITLISRRAE